MLKTESGNIRKDTKAKKRHQQFKHKIDNRNKKIYCECDYD